MVMAMAMIMLFFFLFVFVGEFVSLDEQCLQLLLLQREDQFSVGWHFENLLHISWATRLLSSSVHLCVAMSLCFRIKIVSRFANG